MKMMLQTTYMFRYGVSHRRFDEARRNAVDPYPEPSQLLGRGPGESDDPGFGGRVVCLSGVSHLTRDARQVDDGPVRDLLLPHEFGKNLVGDESALEVDVDDLDIERDKT